MNKNKTLRNIIAGVAVAVLVVCIAIPVFNDYFPWNADAKPGDFPSEQVTFATIEDTEPPYVEPETEEETEPPYVEPETEEETEAVAPATTKATAIPTTTKKVTTTKKETTTKKNKTTKKETTTKKDKTTKKATTEKTILNSNPVDDAVKAPVNGEADPRAVLSYKMNAVDGYFYNEEDSWQRNFGFCKAYDQGAQFIFMFYDTVRFKFTAGGYDWLVQIWKGQYGFMFVGTEVGVYYLPEGKGSNQALYKCVPNEDMLNMSTAMFWNGEFVAKRPYKKYWWCTTFIPGNLKKNSDRSQIRMEWVVEMKDAEMADAFEESVISHGFTKAGKSYNSCLKNGFDHSDEYARSGKMFAFNWLLIGSPKPNTSVAY